MNIDRETRRRLNLAPREHHQIYEHAAVFMTGTAVGLLWSAIYLWKMGAF